MKYPHGPAMRGLLEDRRPGCCAACDEPLEPKKRGQGGGNPGVVHQTAECIAVYQVAYQADRRARERALVTVEQAMSRRFEAVPRPHRRKSTRGAR